MLAAAATHLLDGRLAAMAESLGAALGAAGLALGLATLLAFAFTRTGHAGARPAAALAATGAARRSRSHRATSGPRAALCRAIAASPPAAAEAHAAIRC